MTKDVVKTPPVNTTTGPREDAARGEEQPTKIRKELEAKIDPKPEEKDPEPAPQPVLDPSQIDPQFLPDGLHTGNLGVRETLDVARSGKGLASQAEAWRCMASFIDYLLLAGRFDSDAEGEIARRMAELKGHL